MEALKHELLDLLHRNDTLRAALLASRVENPQFEEEAHIEKMLELAAGVWNRCGKIKNDCILKAESINSVLFEDYGLSGKSDKYKHLIDDPNRYYLHRVMETRKGSPLSVTLLYMILAQQVGLEVECYAVPNYFFLKVKDVAGDFYIDAFDYGRFLRPEDFHRKFRVGLERNRMVSTNLFEKVTGFQMVARLFQQLKHVYILKGDALTALRAVEMLTALFPNSPELTRDRGILYCEVEYFSKAMRDLKAYLKSRPNAEDVSEIKKLTSMLKGYREIMN